MLHLNAITVLAAVAGLSGQLARPPIPMFESDILPIFKRARCLSCHGDTLPKAGLVALTRGDLIQGGYSGPSVVPGTPAKSMLYKLLAAGKMPPGGPKLDSASLKRVEKWILAGAPAKHPGSGHWAFNTPTLRPIPVVNPKSRTQNPIDAFLLRDLQGNHLTFSPLADRRTLIRRVTFDLIGLPPTPEEVDSFVSDPRPDAYDRLVDRLLADPRYGERWARHWLDPAGYADSEGVLEEDLIRANAWKYRDYVIRSFNADKPYDRFIREQIAGDELVDYKHAEKWLPEIEEPLIATGFLRTAVDATRPDFNTHQFTEYQYRMLHDTQTILSSAILGLPLQCARCHNHKYEPLTQRDYYRFQAILQGAIRPTGKLLPTGQRQIKAATESDIKRIQANNEEAARKLAAIDAQIAELIKRARARVTDKNAPVEKLAASDPDFKREHDRLTRERAAEAAKQIAIAEIRALYDQDANPPPTRILTRGEWTRPGDAVEPGVPAILAGLPFSLPHADKDASTTGRRKALADWLTDRRNPLTARVIVNRVWAHHFGAGIVPTVENLGRSGAKPTNQALLDWMAVAFTSQSTGGMNSPPNQSEVRLRGLNSRLAMGWSLKKLHRLIVTSSAYCQSSAYRPAAAAIDPDDKLLWRQRQRRLEAEAVRDAMLAVSGSLDPKMYGEPVGIDYRPTGENAVPNEDQPQRRSIYLLVRRSRPNTFLNTFDAPIMETNCTRRLVSTTPTQALSQMNSSFIAAQAARFASRLISESRSPALQVHRAYRLAFGRSPTQIELDSSVRFLGEQTKRYGDSAGRTPKALTDFCQALLSANELIYVD